jgi:hypothetical protein
VACACKGRNAAGARSASVRQPVGTYRVTVNGRQVYESTSEAAAREVASGFNNPTILAPGEQAA